MTSQSNNPQVKEVAAWVQTRVVLRIIVIILAVVALLWIAYKLTAVLLLLVLSIFFAYLVAPLVDLVEQPVNIGGRVIRMPRGVAIGVVYLFLFTVAGAAIYFLVPQFAAQFPEFKQQATSYYKSISDTSNKVNQYFTQHRMPEGMVKAVNDTILNLIAKSGEVAQLAFERALGWIIFLPWIVLIPILSFFLLKDA